MEKENQRAAMSKRMLKEGLLRCLKRTDIDKLTISELCRESGINRATFYRYYQLPKDVLADLGWEYTRKIKEIFKGSPSQPLEKKMTECFQYIYDSRETLNILFSANAGSRFEKEVSEIFPWAWSSIIDLKKKKNLDDDEYRLCISAYSWSAYHIIREWIVNDISKTPEEITELFIRINSRDLYQN